MGSSRPIDRRLVHVLLASLVMAACVGCGSRSQEPQRTQAGSNTSRSTSGTAERPKVVVLGDSLTAGAGLAPEEAYPAILQARIDAEGLNYEVVNAGISGDTSAGGLRRLDWSMAGDVRVLVLALGANDGLRGLPVNELRSNLDVMVRQTKSRRIDVVLAGMEALPNFGKRYADEFHDVYPSLAREHQIALVPFLLEGVAGIDAMNQRDGIHPTADGARIVADNVWKVLAPILRAKAES